MNQALLQPESRRFLWRLIVIFSILAIGIATAGYVYYDGQQKEVKRERHDDLYDIASLKAAEISWWRNERLGDAYGIFDNSLVIAGIHRWMTGPSGGALRQPILDWMASLRKNHDYNNVLLFDASGSVRLALSSDEGYPGAYARNLIAEALRTKKVVLSDLYLSEDKKDVHMDLVIPFFLTQGHETAVGGLLLCIDPQKFLYPLIKSWPSPSGTAETLLVRREGNEVVYLSELRHQKDTPLHLRIPVTEERLLAAMAARGSEGIVEGLDYRGVPVIGAVLRIPDSSWILIAKLDTDEIYATVRERFWLVVLLVSVLIAAAGIVSLSSWRHQNALFYRRQYETERTYRTIFENTGTATIIVEEDTTLSLVNYEFEKLSGYSQEELEGRKSWTDFFAEDDLESAKRYFYQDLADPNPHPRRFEFRFIDRNGTVKDVLASVAIIPGLKKGVGSFLDITERRMAEEAVRKAKDELEMRVIERTATLLELNQALEVEIAGHKRTEKALHESENRLRQLSFQIMNAQETERRRISRELHDGLGQALSLMKLRVRHIEKSFQEDQGALREESENILHYIDEVIEDVRRLSRDLSPSMIESLGLTSALRWLMNNFMKAYSIKVTYDITDINGSLSRDEEIVVYRILQEALSNIGRHSGAKNVTVDIREHEKGFALTVTDDGKGFDAERLFAHDVTDRGLGLAIMDERAKMLGGVFALWSQDGKGTRITVTIRGKGKE